MAGRQEEALPACFAGLGAGSPRPRQKRGGMFCSVEDAFDNKTLNFASLTASGTATPVGGHRRDSQAGPSPDAGASPDPGPGPEPRPEPRPEPSPEPDPAAAALPPRAPAALPDGCRQVTGLRRDRGRGAWARPRREGERGPVRLSSCRPVPFHPVPSRPVPRSSLRERALGPSPRRGSEQGTVRGRRAAAFPSGARL